MEGREETRSIDHRPLALPNQDGFLVVRREEILFCSSHDNYSEVHFTQESRGRLVLSRTLKDVERFLAAHGFVRVHQGFLVNIVHVREYQRRSSGAELELSDGTRIPVSRRFRQQLMDRLDLLPPRSIR
ncbi:MAG: LytTR family transcriptional regulator [Flavobacteriales bacterium]|nr:LytTR family transcriptional regulator [Flavobacteriales bacterium]